MPKEENKTVKYNHREKSMKAPSVIYAGSECLLEKLKTCHTNPEKSSTAKIAEHKPFGYSLFTHCLSDVTKNKVDYYRGKDCMEDICNKSNQLYEKRNDTINN